ncbi:MAG: GvpL/GvpF family gas vesicle protein [Acidimicrobiaceae bacterium]|nr:GvpL/GvpF family gas vesicle protein [Acidimicrobiaceae bacterium]
MIPADVESDSDARGVGNPPARISVVRHGHVAALVSEVDLGKPLGTPEDLAAHHRVLSAVVVEVPVLPMRFGAVVTDIGAVKEELLGPLHEGFSAALKELEGKAEFVVKGRYREETILLEVLSEVPEARRLGSQIQDQPSNATRNERFRLGELINQAIAIKRNQDTDTVLRTLEHRCVSSRVREPTHEEDAAHVAVLVELEGEEELMDAVDDLRKMWDGRVDLQVLGPMAAYDFVVAAPPPS